MYVLSIVSDFLIFFHNQGRSDINQPQSQDVCDMGPASFWKKPQSGAPQRGPRSLQNIFMKFK